MIMTTYSTNQFVPVPSDAVPEDFDCPMRQLALEFAMEIQPFLSKDQLQEIADALNGARETVNKSCVTAVSVPTNWHKQHRETMSWNDLIDIVSEPSIFVDFVNGNDDNDGSINHPIKHLDFAVQIARNRHGKNVYKRIILRKGRHYLRKTIQIISKDNNLLITNYNNEKVEISGAIPIQCTWKNIKGNMYSCDLSQNSKVTTIKGLRVNGIRAIRARFPNGNPEVYPCGFCSELRALKWVGANCTNHPTKEYNPRYPDRNDTVPMGVWEFYDLGIGGCCDIFTPPAGYWCGTKSGSAPFAMPGGFVYNASILPNAPYKDIRGGVVQAWRPGHWNSWMFEMDPTTYNPTTGTILFSKGGFQGSRGVQAAHEFYVENIFEELDYPTEYFFNESSNILYYINNQSGSPTNLVFEVVNLKVLFNYSGTMANPAQNHEIRGITLQDAQITYLDDHGMPSGGDWALQRQGAVYLDGVKNINISSNIFTRLDGNAISINRYARDVVIYRNEFVWQGDSVITAWGDTQNISFADGTVMGWDGTDGNQPRGVQVIQNFVHEIGIWEKQSSMWFQAKSCSNILDSNIFFNGPRAAINFNDGFGGNSTLKKNLLFNTCRESGDHGPFNTWDRQPYVTKVLNGSASVIKQYDYIDQNFMIANYNAQEAVDTDDGACYYETTSNFLVYSGNGMKNDFGGHDNHAHDNIYGYINGCFSINDQIAGHQDKWYNNTCILNEGKPGNYGNFDCGTTNAWPKLGGNVIYQMDENTTVTGLCNLNEKEFQQKYPGADDGTVIKGPPNNNDIIAQAKNMLFS